MADLSVRVGTSGGDGDRFTPTSHGGWKVVLFILGYQAFGSLATSSLTAKFLTYFMTMYRMDFNSAGRLIDIWFVLSNISTLLGALLADAIFGRFYIIIFSSLTSFFGMVIITLTAWTPDLRPEQCPSLVQCPSVGPNKAQFVFLILGMALLIVGTAGFRSCSLPFGVDQFDPTSEEGRKGISSYYNWYYTTLVVMVVLKLTVMVYVHEQWKSWVVEFGISTVLMLASIVTILIGTRHYVHIRPEGGIYSSVVQVFVAAFRKRHLQLPGGEETVDYYDPPLEGIATLKLNLTDELRFLNKGAIMERGDLNEEGGPRSKWRLCSVHKIEEVKYMIRVIPVWASGIVCYAAAAELYTATVRQTLTMERHISTFHIPVESVVVVAMLTIATWVPVYDRLVVPMLRKITNHEDGITLLQRMGVGLFLSMASMIVAGVIEKHRRDWSLANGKVLSVFWLAPQLILLGISEGFNFIGQVQFYDRQFPEKMRSLATSIFFCTIVGGRYLSSLFTDLIHNLFRRLGKHAWFDDNLDRARLDYTYYMFAGIGGLNLVFFIMVSIRCRYKNHIA